MTVPAKAQFSAEKFCGVLCSVTRDGWTRGRGSGVVVGVREGRWDWRRRMSTKWPVGEVRTRVLVGSLGGCGGWARKRRVVAVGFWGIWGGMCIHTLVGGVGGWFWLKLMRNDYGFFEFGVMLGCGAVYL